ncbi:MAG: MauE/DoxX family redox-associated membrane protein [Chitinophagaceae bacterium]
MRIAVNISRIIVGVLFIISGLVKANDPLSLSYKMQEFFEIWNASLSTSSFFAKDFFIQSFHFFNDQSLALSIIMITLEVMAGIALLIGWRKKLVLNLLFILIAFFTFLTAYAYLSGKFKNCGCFGDCLPITPLISFLKDIILLALILFLLFFQKYIQPIFSKRTQGLTLLASLLFTLGLQWYVLNYLPLADCLPFKKGASIPEKMKIPINAVQDSFAMKFIYEKEGKRFEFAQL